MNNFIQQIEVLSREELKTVNEYIDTLDFQPNKIFGADGQARVDNSIRSSLGAAMTDGETATDYFSSRRYSSSRI